MGDFPLLGVAAGAPPRSREELVARNRQLMLDLAEAAGAIGRPDALANFKSMSSAYQRAQLPPAAYLDAFANLFGIAAARRLFPELALLLPDARRRAELEDASPPSSATSCKSRSGATAAAATPAATAAAGRAPPRRRAPPPEPSGWSSAGPYWTG